MQSDQAHEGMARIGWVNARICYALIIRDLCIWLRLPRALRHESRGLVFLCLQECMTRSMLRIPMDDAVLVPVDCGVCCVPCMSATCPLK
jgi:hypothetical protein